MPHATALRTDVVVCSCWVDVTPCLFCSYVVGAVCGIVSGLDEATSKFHQTMDQLNLYMAEYHIPKPLQYSLREYFRHCRTLSRERYYHDLLVQMSPSLRGQVAVFCHRCVL